MDSEAMRAHKTRLRTQLRSRRREDYGGRAGAVRRDQEARRLLAHGTVLLEGVVAAAGPDPAAPPLVAAFHPTPAEADVMPLARALVARGAQLVFPAAAGRELEWITWDGVSDFVPSPGRGFGREPDGERLGPAALARAGLVLAPALAVDRSGTRIGHGAGYYDRALLHVRPETPVVAVIHPAELLEEGALPRGEHDVPIGRVLTADGLVTLTTS